MLIIIPSCLLSSLWIIVIILPIANSGGIMWSLYDMYTLTWFRIYPNNANMLKQFSAKYPMTENLSYVSSLMEFTPFLKREQWKTSSFNIMCL